MDLKSVYGSILFSAAVATIKDLVIAAVKTQTDLRGAYLQRAYLLGAYLQGANLQGANLQEAYLQRAYLQGANLQEADLRGAYLQEAYLQGANLRGADLRGADLQGADLQGAYLLGAYLQGANLQGAYLQGAYLQGANLQGANLRGADLQGAYLQEAYLQRAYLQGAKNIPELAAAQTILLPEGPITGWKKCQNDVIVKLLIPYKARRSNATGRKCRAEFVKVLQVFGAEIGVSTHNGTTQYRKGETVACDIWNEDRWTECGGGIHFFITRIEAEKY